MPLRPHRMHRGRSRAVLGAVTAVVLLAQTAPAASGLLASFLHGTFHLTSRTGLEHLETTMATQGAGRAAGAGDNLPNHTHPGEPGHVHGLDGSNHVHRLEDSDHVHRLDGSDDVQASGDGEHRRVQSSAEAHGHPHTHPHPQAQHHPHAQARTPRATADEDNPNEVTPPQRVAEEPATVRNVHTHGPGQAPHAHAPVVDAALEIAAASEGPAVGPTATLDRSAERYLRPDRPELAPVLSATAISNPDPDAPASPLASDPPVPPPRA